MGSSGAATTPGRVASVLARERLLSVLDEAFGRRLTTIVGPAGYGKTALLDRWAASRTDDTIAWLTLGAEHNELRRLAGDISDAFSALERARSGIVILDNFEQLTNGAALNRCAGVIQHAPETLHVVLASRADPPARFSRLALSGALAEVGADELAFTRDEAAELLGELDGGAADETQVDGLMARTWGWPLAVEVVARSERGEVELEKYLADEVLNRQPIEVQRFLVSTSVLGRMSGPLCDFVTSCRSSQAVLEDLERAGAFVFGLDEGHNWFVCHPMFRSMLRRRLREGDDGGEERLLHRAADWHLARGQVDEGVRYLVDANAADEVIEAAFTHAPSMLKQDQAANVAGWIQQAEPAPERVPTGAVLLEAAALVFGNTPAGAREILDSVRTDSEASPAERIVGDLLLAYVELAEGSGAEAMAASERVLAAVSGVEQGDLPNVFGVTCTRLDVEAAALVARAVSEMYEGRLPAARADLEAVDGEAHGVWRAPALGALALVEAWSGNLSRGEGLAIRSLALADSLGYGSASRTTAWLAQAFVARRRNELDRAATLLEEVEWNGDTRRRAVAVWVATERALIALATDIAQAGRAALAGQLVSAHPSLPSGVLARRWAAEAQLLIATGDLDHVEQIVELGVPAGTELMEARVRLAVERGDMAEAHALVDAWPDEPQPRAGREHRLWTSVIDHLEGNEARASATLAAVVAEAEAEGDVGLFQGAGKYALGPARALYRSGPTAFLRSLVDLPPIAVQARPAKGLPEQLTDREYMVLVHLPSRQSNAEIAERLGVSLNTVKTHLKHIYRKLDVMGRTEAVEAAERLRLL